MNDLIKNSKSVDYVKNRVKARRFKKEDAKEVRNLIVRNFLEINSRDYGLSAMETLAKVYDEEKVLNVQVMRICTFLNLKKKLLEQVLSQVFGVVKQRAYFCVFLFFRNFMEKVLEAKL